LTFTNPILEATNRVPALRSANDVVIALTHIGFTQDPGSVEVDNNVDTYLAANVPGIDVIVGGHSHTNPSSPTTPYQYLPGIFANGTIIGHAYRYNNTLDEIFLGLRSNGTGGYEVVSRAGRFLKTSSSTYEDPVINNLVRPYRLLLDSYNNMVIGQTTAPIDALLAYTEETNGANFQADASVYELSLHGIGVNFHLSGAMSNRKVAATATPVNPVTLKISDMFQLMPYENSLVVLNINGPQLKAILERAYRNFWYYNYTTDHGGYSYYTTCMIDINAGGQITYNDTPAVYDPGVDHVVALTWGGGNVVDFNDATTYYRVSTVNYLAAGSCNFNDAGVSLWPLNQIANDTQYYVRDATINYVRGMGIVSPAIEGRLVFSTTPFTFLTKLFMPFVNK